MIGIGVDRRRAVKVHGGFGVMDNRGAGPDLLHGMTE